MAIRPKQLLLFLSCVTFLAGCSDTAPRLSVVGVREIERTDQGTVLAIDIDAENANDEAMPLREIGYSISINGRTVFAGARSPEATIRRFGTQRLTVPAVVSGSGTSTSGVYEVRGDLEYVAPGRLAEILFDTGVRTPSASFVGRGAVTK
ncbi:MAG: LEA type 2 family protein [Planctomycetota bacterium]